MKNKKSLGQHWLTDRSILDGIADLAIVENPSAALAVEIGPGLGTLTSSLLKRFAKVIAVEYDASLAANLPKSFPGKNLAVVNEDILTYDFSHIHEPYVVVGNIPYYITTPIILRLLQILPAPAKIVLLIQKEVAERATPVKNHENLLSLAIKNRADAFREFTVPRDKFTPAPKVDSQILVLKPHAPLVDEKVLMLAKIGFSSPRKKLLGNLAAGLQLPRANLQEIFLNLGIDTDARPAELSLDDWARLLPQLSDQ